MKQYKIAAIALLFVVPLLLVPALPGHAAEQTGKINGTVYDPDGVPLAGVTVTITSSNMMGKRKTQTSEDGSFLFFGLPPGKYTIEIDQSGFLPYKQEQVRVSIGGTSSLDILLEVPTAEETITVTAKRPVVDKEKTQLGENYDDEFLEEIPVGRSYQSVAQLAPGVTGGQNPNVHGGSMFQNAYLIDGINTTDPATKTFALSLNYDAIKEVQVITGGLDAQYGQVSGGIVNVVTKSGGNEFHIDTSFYVIPDWLRLRDAFEREAIGEENTYTYNFNVGGPIIKDRLWYFGSVEIYQSTSYAPPTEDFFDPTNPDLLTHPPRKWLALNYLAKLTFQASDKHKLTGMVTGDPGWIDNMAQATTFGPGVEEKRFQYGGFYSLAWEALWSKNLFQKTQVGLAYSGMIQEPMSGCVDRNNPECRSHYDSVTGLRTVNWNRNSEDHRYRLQTDSSWTYYLDDLLGDHEAKVGFNYTHSWTDFKNEYPGGGVYTDQAGRPYQLTIMAPDPLTGEPQPYITSYNNNILGVYLQDTWKITKTLTLKPGARVDWVQINDYKNESVIEYLTTSPRINLVWDATGDGKTVVRVGYNRYVDPGWFNVASFLGKAFVTETYQYNPSTGKYDIFVRRDGEEQNVIRGENETAPHADEISIQAERELFTDFSLGVNVLWREFKFAFEDDEVNEIWNQEGTKRIGFKNGDETYIYRTGNPKEAWRRYWGFEVVLRKNFSDNWQASGSYVYSRSEGVGEDYWTSFLDNPRQDPFYWSWSSFDRRHTIKLDGSYHLPYGVEIGASVRWATGVPYSKIFMDEEYQAYYQYRTKRGYDPDHPENDYWNRTPDTFGLNLLVVWDLKELTGQQIDLRARMLNVMHLRYKIDLETRDMPPGQPRQYGNYYAMSSGFRAELGIRYRY
jgi:outer membrane receptor for ferrienterochelin and colicin